MRFCLAERQPRYGKFARRFSINEDAFHRSIPGRRDVVPTLRFDQPGFGFVKSQAIESAAIIRNEGDASSVDEQSDSAVVREVVLCDQALPVVYSEWTNPAFQG